MKKGRILLLMCLALSIGIIVGFFIARNNSSNVVLLSPANAIPTVSETSDYRLDLNTVTVSQLTLLPGIGETLAGRIVAYRDENGQFDSVEELLEVEGIGQKTLEQIKHLVKVGG